MSFITFTATVSIVPSYASSGSSLMDTYACLCTYMQKNPIHNDNKFPTREIRCDMQL